jgi:hypothetical protein
LKAATGPGIRRGAFKTGFVALALAATGCAPCAKHDYAAIERTWRATLDQAFASGASPEAVVRFLESRNVPATYFADQHRVFSFVTLPAADKRLQCRVSLPSALSTDCHFDTKDRLLACTVDADSTSR